jgi:hypothetical protein
MIAADNRDVTIIHPLQISIPMCKKKNLSSTRKSVEIYLLFTCITNLILAIHTQSMNGLEEPF